MQKTNTITPLHRIDAWLMNYAQALLTYAAGDAAFAESLAWHIQSRYWRSNTATGSAPLHPYLVPATQRDAIEHAHWLILTADAHPTAMHTRSLLATWAQDYQAPQDLVIGIVGVAIIGPTLGIIKKKKRQRAALQILVEDQWYQNHSPKALITLVQELSQQVIAKELRLAGGNAFRLHPDSAAWCLEEPFTTVFHTSKAELAAARKAAQGAGLSCAAKPGIALALSPTVKESFAREFTVTEIQ